MFYINKNQYSCLNEKEQVRKQRYDYKRIKVDLNSAIVGENDTFRDCR